MSMVRIERVELRDFKNVRSGVVDFSKESHKCAASILGLYGQNGSGKTALIEAIGLLKFSLSAMSLWSTADVPWGDLISIGAENASLKFRFRIVEEASGKVYEVEYAFCIKKRTMEGALDPSGRREDVENVEIFNETLSFSRLYDGKKSRFQTYMDTSDCDTFKPESKARLFIDGDKGILSDLMVEKKLAREKSRSFIFSPKLDRLLFKGRAMLSGKLREDADSDIKSCMFVIQRLREFGLHDLMVVQGAAFSLLNLNMMPLSFVYNGGNVKTAGTVILPFKGPTVLPEDLFQIVGKVLEEMNIVLQQLVPGLTISIKQIGKQLKDDGSVGVISELVSCKNGKEIPLRSESEGIRKIISVLHLLIEVYNKPSAAIAIDELDSGIFEYLLGELLKIVAERGRGQLIFTSHNLRPLETLDKDFIAFTTTNPSNRYIRLRNVKPSNNLRDFCYREIIIGEQNEKIYEATSNAEIAYAFAQAGDNICRTFEQGPRHGA